MAFQPAPAVAQAIMRLVFQATGAFAAANVLNFKSDTDTAWSEGELTTLGDALAAWWITYMAAITSSQYSLASVDLRGLDSAEAAYASVTVNDQGDAAGDALPLNCCAVVTLRTPFTGRSARGRVYVSGLAESHSNNSTLTTAYGDALDDAWSNFLIEVNGDSPGQLCVLSRYSDGAARATAVPYVVTSASLRDRVVDTQRRRIQRLG